MSGDIFGYYSEGPGVVSRQLRGGGQGCGHPSFGTEDARLPQRRSTQPQMWTAPGVRGPGAHVPRAVSQGHLSTSDGGWQGDADARGSTAREGPGPAGRGPGMVIARGAMPAARFSPSGRASSKPRSKRPGSVGCPPGGRREQGEVPPLRPVRRVDHRRQEQGGRCLEEPSPQGRILLGSPVFFQIAWERLAALRPVSVCWTALRPLGSVAPGTLAGVYVKGARTPRVVQRKGRQTDTVPLSDISASAPNARPCGEAAAGPRRRLPGVSLEAHGIPRDLRPFPGARGRLLVWVKGLLGVSR